MWYNREINHDDNVPFISSVLYAIMKINDISIHQDVSTQHLPMNIQQKVVANGWYSNAEHHSVNVIIALLLICVGKWI